MGYQNGQDTKILQIHYKFTTINRIVVGPIINQALTSRQKIQEPGGICYTYIYNQDYEL